MPRRPTLERFGVLCARGLVEAQRALDERTGRSLERWSEEGIPPSAFYFNGCTLRARASFGPRLAVRAGNGGPETLTIAFRYVLREQGD